LGQEKEEQKEKEEHIIQEFAKLYEQNIGLVNGVVSEWLIDISKYVDIKLFKKAIEIATNNGRCNKGYVSGILKQWESKNIKTYSDLKAYEVSVKNTGGNDNGTNNNNNAKNRYLEELESEDQELYRKPTKEQLEQARRLLEES
jgi:DnaD/phage-associated family protein